MGPRLCGIPHPYPYCRLVERIHGEWNRIEPLLTSKSSQIQAKLHADGRLFVMDYESQYNRSQAYLERQATMKYVARADISHFYPSIYTHSLAWAAVGLDEAKANQNVGSKWYNKLDKAVRECKRNETNGILIAPGTSSLMAELLLAEVDRRLETAGYKFLRFIDDYTCFAETREVAASFIRNLEIALSRYNLFLNFSKTFVGPLSGSELPDWIPALQADNLPQSPNFFSLKLFFSRAVSLASKHPEGSVLRYAVHTLKGRALSRKSGDYVLRTLLALALHHPHLVGAIDDFLEFGFENGEFKYKFELIALIENSTKARRSDAICWSLYLALKVGITLADDYARPRMKLYDPCSLVVLYEATNSNSRRAITNYVKKQILPRDHTAHERNWIIIHYLLNTGRIKPSDVPDNTLKLLQREKVDLFQFT